MASEFVELQLSEFDFARRESLRGSGVGRKI